jgi:hypothetical protein
VAPRSWCSLSDATPNTSSVGEPGRVRVRGSVRPRCHLPRRHDDYRGRSSDDRRNGRSGSRCVAHDGPGSGCSDGAPTWTGSELVVWSGGTKANPVRGGVAYRPDTNQWREFEGGPGRGAHRTGPGRDGMDACSHGRFGPGRSFSCGVAPTGADRDGTASRSGRCEGRRHARGAADEGASIGIGAAAFIERLGTRQPQLAASSTTSRPRWLGVLGVAAPAVASNRPGDRDLREVGWSREACARERNLNA